MRKKKILEQNMLLFKQLGDAKAQIELLKAELKKNTEILERIKSEAVQKEKEKNSSEPLKQLEKKIQRNAFSLDPHLQFASETIGKIVIESARYCNMLTADGETKYKELVNLILGRTEVAKSEILAITKKEISEEQKQAEIMAVKDNTVEYFGLVMAQKN